MYGLGLNINFLTLALKGFGLCLVPFGHVNIPGPDVYLLYELQELSSC